MVHGIFLRKRPPVESVDVMLKLLDLLIAALDPILSQLILVPTDDGLVETMGPTMGLMSERMLSKEYKHSTETNHSSLKKNESCHCLHGSP